MLKELLAALGPGNWLGMKPQIDPAKTPIELDFQPNPVEIKVRAIIGLVVLGVAAAVWWVLGRGDMVLAIVAGGFAFFALLNLLVAVSQIGYRKRFYLTSASANVTITSLLGKHKWTEQLATYEGVMLRTERFRETGINTSSRTYKSYHVAELYHRNPSRRIPLWVDREIGPARTAQEAFAKRLKLPAIAPDVGGFASRDARSLDQSVTERAAALAVKRVHAEDPGPPPKGVRVWQEGPETVITVVTVRRGKWLAWLSLLLVLGAFVWILYNLVPPDEFLMVAGALAGMIVFMGLIAWGIVKLAGAMGLASSAERKPDELRLSPDGIRLVREGMAVPAVVKSMMGRIASSELISAAENPPLLHLPLAVIEQVRVEEYAHPMGKDDGSGSKAEHSAILYVESDDARLQFGRASGRQLVWVRDFLLFNLSTTGP